MDLKVFLQAIKEEVKGESNSSDILRLTEDVAVSVSGFLASNSIGTTNSKTGRYTIDTSFEEASLEALGAESVAALVAEAGVPAEFAQQAAEEVGTILYKAANAGSDFTATISIQSEKASNNGSTAVIGVEDILPASMQSAYAEANVGTEAFGNNTDKVISDLQTAVVISLLKWHNTITPRVLSTIATAQPVASYVREECAIYNLEDSIENDKSVLDLYGDPSPVSNELTRIDVLEANDTAAGTDVLVSDGILRFGVNVPMLELGIDSTRYGHGNINRTDIVADGVKLETIIVEIDTDGAAAEQFDIAVPSNVARLTRMNNSVSAMRGAQVSFTAILDVDSVNRAGAVSPALTEILGATGDKLVLTLEVSPRMDLRTGSTFALGDVSVEAKSADNGVAATATTDELALATTGLYGYTVDARYAEENNRKSNIAATIERTQLQYEIPQGRNYLIDVPHNGPDVNRSRNVANLHNVIRIGQDNVTLSFIESMLEEVGLATAAYAANPSRANKPGASYVAGGRVKPVFVQDTLDVTSIDQYSDAERQSAIEGKVMTFLNSVCGEIMTKSYFDQQLDGGKSPVFRLVTSGRVLTNVLGAKPGSFAMENGNGVQLTLKLSSGIILEVITTTFDTMNDKMILVPFLAGDPKSDLNFGHNRDYGTIVGSYSHSEGGSSVNRLLANVREVPIPTNVIGAIVDVTGIDAAAYR